MIKKVLLNIGNHINILNKGTPPPSKRKINFAHDFFQEEERVIKSLRVINEGHEAFKNGFVSKK
jgi:hypothetical protein